MTQLSNLIRGTRDPTTKIYRKLLNWNTRMNDTVIAPTIPDAWQDNRLDYIPYHVRSKQVTYTLIYLRHAHDNGVEEAEDVLVCTTYT